HTTLVLDLHLEAARATQAVYRRRTKDTDLGFLDLFVIGLAQPRDHRISPYFLIPGPLLEWFEDDEHAPGVGDVRTRQYRVTVKSVGVGASWIVSGYLSHPRHDRLGPLKAGPVGQLAINHQVTLVLLRNKTHRDCPESEHGQD